MIKPQTKINSHSEYLQFCRKSLRSFFENRKAIIYYLRDNRHRTLLRYEPDMKALRESIKDLSQDKILDKIQKIKAKEIYSRGIPYGVLIAFKDGSDVRIGYNFCVQEPFVKSTALIKAINKSRSIDCSFQQLVETSPTAVSENMPSFLGRITKYFNIKEDLVKRYNFMVSDFKERERKERASKSNTN